MTVSSYGFGVIIPQKQKKATRLQLLPIYATVSGGDDL